MPTKFYSFRFNPRRVIERYGGVDNTYRVMSSMGATLTVKSVRKWVQRDTVPAEAIIALHLYDRSKRPVKSDLFDTYYQEGFDDDNNQAA